MRKSTFFKTLLVGACLVGSANAWAEVTPYSEAYSAESTTTGWTPSISGRFNPVILNEDGNYFLSVDQSQRNNNGGQVTGNILSGKAAAGDDFTLTFDMRLGSSNNQNPAELEIKDAANAASILKLSATGKNVTTWKINGSDLQVTLPNSGTGTATDGSAIAGITWVTYKISRSGALTYLTITNKATGTAILERQTIDNASETGGLGNIVFTSKRYYANFAIDNIEVRELQDGDVPAVTLVNYTIKYVDESSNKIAEDVVVNSFVGAKVTASSAQTAAVYKDEKKYLYKSGNDETTLVADAASNVITLVYREAATFGYTVNAVDGENNVIKVLATGTAFEEDAIRASYPVYVNVDGTLYTKAATNQSYHTTLTLDADNKVLNYTYSPTSQENVAFYVEGEDIAGATIFDSGNADARSSNAAVGYAVDSDLEIATLPAGQYVINAVGFFPLSGGGTVTITDGTNTVLDITGKSSNATTADAGVTLYATTTLYLKAGGNDNVALDYIWAVKTGDAPTSVTTPAANATGYATFASDAALDFTGKTTKAYIITGVNENVVVAKQVEKVPAGTALLLEGADSEEIPVLAGEADDVTGNLLERGTGATVDDGYVLVNREGVAKFAPIGATKPTVAADQAYLNYAAAARELSIVFEGETTGISSVKAAQNGAAVYNLAGQRVLKAQKGLYIQNGKKIIVK